MKRASLAQWRIYFLRISIAAVGLLWQSTDAIGAVNYTAINRYTLTTPAGLTGTNPSNVSAYELGYQSAAGGQEGGYGYTPGGNPLIHAVYWNASGVPFDLHPAGFVESQVFATDGVHQVGGVPNDGRGFTPIAFLWSGTAASAVNLNPASGTASWAYGVSGNQQVGAARFGGNQHAMLWNGTAASAVDLNPTNLPGVTYSVAYATDGVHQVGEGKDHAMIWAGTANSAVDLHPASGYSRTYAYGVSGTQQVGGGYNNNTNKFNALLWNSSAASMVNLNLTGYSETTATDTNGSVQVGWGFTPTTSNVQALLWSGTAASVFNLGSLLPSSMTFSKALSVDSAGNVFGIARDSSHWYAIEWQPVPEPASLCLAMIAGLAMGRRRR